MLRLLSLIFVNIKSTDKCYRNKRSTSPIEIMNNKKLKEKQIDILRTISKHKVSMTNDIQQYIKKRLKVASPLNYWKFNIHRRLRV